MVTVEGVTELIAQLGGLAILAGTLAGVGAFVYRWYVREQIPRGLALLLGLSGVAIYLNTTAALGQVIGGSSAPTETEVALFNIAAFLVAAGGVTLGQWAGDWGAAELFLGEGFADVEEDVGRLVKSVGRVVAVSLPQEIDDVVGYDPVPEETKETLAGKTFMFPRRITVEELRSRLTSRLKADYGVGHVDIELADDGSVEYLALGSRAAGIGPTLPPATNAVAIRADPAFAASAGDLVQVWETDPMRRVLTAELRGVADDTVTIAIDAADTQKLDPRKQYRLVTLPVEDRPDREFASLLRAADETFSSVTVEAGSPLHGLPVGALDLSVVAVKPDDETPMALPDPGTVLAPGDVVFAIARPEALRRLEVATEPLDPALVREPSPPRRSRSGSAAGEAQQPPAQTDQGAPKMSPETDDEPAAPDASAKSPEAADAADQTSNDDDAVPADSPAPTADADTAGAELEADTDETEPEEGTADFDPPAASDDGQSGETEESGEAGGSSFQQLKDEFDSGEAEWAEDESRAGDEPATASASADSDDSEAAFEDESGDGTDDDGDGLMNDDGLDSALGDAGDDLDGLDIGEDDSADEGLNVEEDAPAENGDDTFEDDESDDLSGLGFDEGDDDLDSLGFDDDEDDDLSSLSFDEDEDDEGLSLDADEADGDDEDDEDDADSADDDDDDDDSGGGGGASSFQQLKEEFESGDADWEDDISDSPGGDMRLDE
jgi:hypothetical protein